MNPEELYKDLGRRIRFRRIELGLNQAQLGDRAGISRASISNIEAGRHQLLLHVVISIARALETSLDELMPAIVRPRRSSAHVESDEERKWLQQVVRAVS